MAIEKEQLINFLNGEGEVDAKAESLIEMFTKSFEEEKTKILLNKEDIKKEKTEEINKRHAVEEERNKLSEQVKQLQEQLKATSPEQIQQVYEKQLADAKQIFDKDITEMKAKLEVSEKTIASLNQEKFKLSCMEEFNKAIAGKDIDPAGLADLSLLVMGPDCYKFSKRSLGEGQEVIVDSEGRTVKAALDAYLETNMGKRFVVMNMTGGGAEGGSKNNIPANIVNPWKKETFNLTKQAEILKENPQLAAQLKAQA